jgi:hypothetical protein
LSLPVSTLSVQSSFSLLTLVVGVLEDSKGRQDDEKERASVMERGIRQQGYGREEIDEKRARE